MSEKHIDLVMRLVDRVTRPLADIRRDMAATETMHRRLGREIQNVGRAFGDLGNTLMPVSAGIVAAAALGANAFIDFDATITAAGAKAGATAAEMTQLRNTASQLGADFPISATAAAQGMDRLAAAGYNAQQIMGAMPAIITASVASGEDLATTSDVVSSALNIWNLKSGDVAANAAHVADVVQMAANQSALGMQDFSLAMQYAGAPAAALNVSIEELSTAMAIMRNNGIDASTIGTSLRSTFSRLAEPPKPAAEAIAALGLQTKDAAGNFIGLQQIVGQMRTAMMGLSNTEQVAYAKALAGEDAYSGLLALIKTAPEDYQAMADAINNAAGSSDAQFSIMQQTMKVTLDGMLGSFESLAISIGTAVTPQVTAVLNVLASFADTLNAMPDGMKVFAFDLAAGIVALTAFSFAMSGILSVGGGVYKTLADIGNGMKDTGQGTRGVAVMTRTLVRGLRSARTEAIRAGTAVLDFATTARNASWASIGASMQTALPTRAGMAARLTALRASMVSTGTAAVNMVRSFSLMQAVSGVGNAMTAAGVGIRSLGTSLRAAAVASRAFILSPLGLALIAIAGAVYLLYTRWDQFAPYFLSMWQSIQDAVGTAVTAIQPALQNVYNTFEPLVTAMRGFFGATAEGRTVLGMLLIPLEALAAILGGALLSAIIMAAGLISNAIVTAINIATSVITMFLGVLDSVITFITGVFSGNWAMAWQGVVTVFSSIFGGIRGVCDGVLNGIRGAINAVIDGINSISVDIPEWVPNVGGQHFGLILPHLYTGTEYWRGGPAVVHDRGAEVINLPTGTQVWPHSQSLNAAYTAGRRSGNVAFGDINITFTGAAVTPETARELANEIVYELSVRMANQNEGAI
ncbi:phage tail tape measure protein [uncultured Megasphaera sp.]|uniref:phage tail tape measure protein n=1 Tax=uncultured Megasphaera sp. TaxID=165188 RepID=UPI00265931EF|nr:phage tail tape measure protein [uncultured Megasphaera sp.]